MKQILLALALATVALAAQAKTEHIFYTCQDAVAQQVASFFASALGASSISNL